MTAYRTAGPATHRRPSKLAEPRARWRGSAAGRIAVALAALLVGGRAAGAEPLARAAPTVRLEEGPGGAGGSGQPASLPNAACLAESLAVQPGADGYGGRVAVALAPGGGLSSVKLLEPATADQERAIQAAFSACSWPAAPLGGRALVVRVTPPAVYLARQPALSVENSPGPPPPPVSLDGKSLKLGTEKAAGFRRPVPVDEGCLYVKLRGKPKLAGLDNKVKFAVLRDGSVSHLSFLSPVDPEVEALVAEAFAACRWVPAADPQGEPLAVWVVQPLKIADLP